LSAVRDSVHRGREIEMEKDREEPSETDHRGGTDPGAGGRHKERPSRRKGGDVLLGYSGRTAVRREQCDVSPKAGISEPALFPRQRTRKTFTPQRSNSSSERCMTTEW
jgi:hypothetical protein